VGVVIKAIGGVLMVTEVLYILTWQIHEPTRDKAAES
jgi:hypothetical protein